MDTSTNKTPTAAAEVRPQVRATSRALKSPAPYILALAGLAATSLILFFILAGAADASDSRTFNGRYDWSSGGSGSLDVTFTPEGRADGVPTWKVRFDFTFNGRDYTWKGDAAGGLEEGATVEGKARGSRRDWVFRGTVKDGVISGDHAQVRRNGGERKSGTFSITAQDASNPAPQSTVVLAR
ncbi:MAG: hypothetical protein AAGM22_13795 [Acidobacteriota bacterium]